MLNQKIYPIILTALLVTVGSPFAWSAPAVFVGSNAATPLAMYSQTGVFLGNFGPDDAVAGAPTGGGFVYLAYDQPTSYIALADNIGTVVSTYPFNGSGASFPNYMTDLGYGAGSLWVSGFNGNVYRLAPTTGAVLSSFNTGSTWTGVTTDNTYLYTTTGIGSGVIEKWTLNGTPVGTISTPLFDTLGVGYDATTNTLWVGGFDLLTQLNLSGNVLAQYEIPGLHSGVEVGNIGTPTPPIEIPEPAPAMAVGLCGFVIVIYRRIFDLQTHFRV